MLESYLSVCGIFYHGQTMSVTPEFSGPSSEWHHITVALLGGLTLASILFTHIAVVQTPGLDPPPQTAALFIVAATVALIGYLLVRQNSVVGYPAAILTGIIVLAEVALVVGGTYGDAGPETNPIGPGAYIVLALTVIITSALAWRNQSETSSTDQSTATR